MLETFLNPAAWTEGGIVALIGMGIVFSFLCVLIFAMIIMSKAVAWLNTVCPEPVAEVKQVKKAAKSDDTEIAIAIAVAASKA